MDLWHNSGNLDFEKTQKDKLAGFWLKKAQL